LRRHSGHRNVQAAEEHVAGGCVRSRPRAGSGLRDEAGERAVRGARPDFPRGHSSRGGGVLTAEPRDASWRSDPGGKADTRRQVTVSYVKAVVLSLLALVLWAAVVLAGALFGWWRQAIAPPDDAEAFLREAVARISEANRDDAALVLIEN